LHERRKKSGERGGREFSPIPVSGSTSFPLTYYVIPAQAGIQKGDRGQAGDVTTEATLAAKGAARGKALRFRAEDNPQITQIFADLFFCF